MARFRSGAAACLLLASACSRGGGASEGERDAAAGAGKPAVAENSAAPGPVAAARPSATVYRLAGSGIDPVLKFGMPDSDAIAAATKAFGAAGKREHNDECGEGPMDFVAFHDLQLGFQEGKLAGWSLSGNTPALQTAGGITIGTPRKALGKVEVDEQSSLGPEFAIDEVGGILGADGKVEALWAGYPCQFR